MEDGSTLHPEELPEDTHNPAALTPEQQDLVLRHLALVGGHMRNRVPTPHSPRRDREYDELAQVGFLALVRAAARYDPSRNGRFAPYALARIRAAIYRAIHDNFSLIRIPPSAARKARKRPDAPVPHGPVKMLEINQKLEEFMVIKHRPSEPKETIRHVLRRRYEFAVQRALEQMRQRVWRQRNPCDIMARIAEQRLLIATERRQASFSQIGEEFGASASRVCAHERKLVQAVREAIASDPQMPILLEMAREDPDGQDAFMDPERRSRLCKAEIEAFERGFLQLAPPRRAELIYGLIERSADCVPEIARNLFRMTLRIEDDNTRIVA